MEKERFTMLLLEPGEIFFEDYSVQMKMIDTSTPDKQDWIDGRLKLCSKSLVFVNKDINQPLIKIQLKETIDVDQCETSCDTSKSKYILMVQCKQYVKMLEKNILAPHKFIHQNTTFYFYFNYAEVSDCLPQILQLLRAATLPTAEQNVMIMAIVLSRQSRVSFDTSWLEDLYEQVVLEIQANKVSPLVINPGRILLTTSRIYFQPYNNLDQYPVLKIQLKDIFNIIKRRFLLRQTGLEIKWLKQPENKVEHLFISLKNENDRDELYVSLLNQPAVSLERVPQDHMTIRWQNGSLSNYDYLLYINSLADRTFHDLTQYPVMPWVLQDYTSPTLELNDPSIYRDLSKPIGALEKDRLERLKERYSEMSKPKFLYGSHYSAPGFVLFYLVRKFPQYMLCLQNGRFDHPDRMFNSVADVWKNVLVNMSDFKELIPEFYDTSSGGDFLVNSYGIDFGYRHDGTKIGDVQLPPWANGPAHFVQVLRNALESDIVSENLHQWIDLIFGYKQRGIEADKANNVFFHLCYEGAVDLDTIRDINERHSLEVQIMEFGQIPKQVFTSPHPKRTTVSIMDKLCAETVLMSVKSGTEDKEDTRKIFELHELMIFQSHKECVSSIIVPTKEEVDEVISVGQDGILKLYSIKNKKLTRSVSLSSLPLSSCILYRTPSHRNILVAGSWDNSLIFYDIEFGRVIDVLQGHEDAVSCLALSATRQIIISGSWDCTAKIWRCYKSGTKIKPAECFIIQLDHDSKVTCINISRDETLLVSGTGDGEIFLWNMDTYNLQFSVKAHSSKINAMVFEEGRSIISCAEDKVLNIIDVHTSTQIYRTSIEHEPLTLVYFDIFLLVGDSNGNINVWNRQDAVFITQIHCHDGPINALSVSRKNNIVLTGGKDRKIIVWDYKIT